MLSGVSIRTIPCPGSGTPRDLAIDGQSLWVTSQADARIYRISIDDGAILSSFASPAANPGGIAVVHEHELGDLLFDESGYEGGGILLHTDWHTNTFYILSKAGNVIRSFSMGGMVNLGIGLVHVGDCKAVVVGGGAEPQLCALINFQRNQTTLIANSSINVRRGGGYDGRIAIFPSIADSNFKIVDIAAPPVLLGTIANPMPNPPAGCTFDGRTLYAINPTTMLIHQIA